MSSVVSRDRAALPHGVMSPWLVVPAGWGGGKMHPHLMCWLEPAVVPCQGQHWDRGFAATVEGTVRALVPANQGN